MKHRSVQSNRLSRFFTMQERTRLPALFLAVLLLFLSVSIPWAGAQSAKPLDSVPHGDRISVQKPDAPSPEAQKPIEETPQQFRQVTLELEEGCPAGSLQAGLARLRADGQMPQTPLRVDNQMQLVIGKEARSELDQLPCVREIKAGWSDLTLQPSVEATAPQRKPQPPLERGERQLAPAGTGSISGTVTAENGGAQLKNIEVYAYYFDVGNGWWDWATWTTTDVNGFYELQGLDTADYRVEYYDYSGNYLNEIYDDVQEFDNATDISVTDGSPTTGINAALADAGHITGTVTAEAGGAPLPNIYVEAYRFNGSYWQYTFQGYSDVNGYYDLGGLPTGTYRIGFFDWDNGAYAFEYYDNSPDPDSGADIQVIAGGTTPGKNIALATAAHITGIVTAANGGAPLEDIYVTAYHLTSSGWTSVSWDYTDAAGFYDLGGLPAGTFRLQFTDFDGFYATEYYDDDPVLYSAADVFVSAANTTSGINASLSEAATLSGTVTAEDGGLALADIQVCPYYYNGSYWQYIFKCLYTDSSGQYQIDDLMPGLYRLRFRDYDYIYAAEYFDNVLDLDTATDISLTPGSTVSGINAALATGGHITGTVTADDGGAPLPDIYVEAYRFNGSYWDYMNGGYTDANGFYDIGGLPVGTYRLGFYDWDSGQYATEYYDNAPDLDSGTDISVPTGSTTTGKDAALAAAAHITGTVTAENGGAPLPGIYIDAYRFNGSYWDYINGGYTDANGFYDIGGLPAGTYRLGFFDWDSGTYATEYYDNEVELDDATDIDLQAAETVPNMDAALAAASQISGIITADSDSSPINGITVWAYRYNDAGSYWDYLTGRTTDQNGYYILDGLAPGTYRIEFYDGAELYAKEVYDDVFDLYDGTDIAVSAGSDIIGIDAALAAAAHITGTVTTEIGGAPLEYITAVAYAFNGIDWLWVSSDDTDAAGQYDIGRLPAGTYHIAYFDWNSGTYITEYYDDAPDLDSGTDIIISTGSTTTNIDAALAENGQINGTVTAENGGFPLQNIGVVVYRFDGSNWNYFNDAYTDAFGFYEVGYLPPGNYRVGFFDWNSYFYAPEYYDNALDVNTADDVAVTSSSTTANINAALPEYGHISGTVTAAVGGAPLSNVQVCAYFYYDSSWYDWSCDYTLGNGSYDIDGLQTGNYRLRFIQYNGVYAFEYYDNALNLIGADDVSVTAGSTTSGINAALGSGGSISGTVTAEAGGAPLYDIEVCAIFDNGFYWESVGCGYTDGNGDYIINGLQTGIYRIKFKDYNGGYAFEYYYDAPNHAAADDIAVTAGSATPDIDAALAALLPPANDDIDNAALIAAATFNTSQSVEGATTAVDDPDLSCGPGDQGYGSVWYAITPSQTTTLTADTFGSDYDTVLAIWQGTRGSLSLVACNDDWNSLQSQLVDVPLVSGTTYYIEIAGYNSNLSELTLNVYLQYASSITQEILLSAGWNMISSYVDPDDPALETLLADIESDMVLIKNDDGQVYWPANGVSGFDAWDIHDGYQIFMNNPATLSITGAQIDPTSTSIGLLAGWNTVPYLRAAALPIDQALAGISGQLGLAKNGYGEVYWPAYNVDQIGNMQPGEGYQVYMNTSGTLIYPAE